MSVIIFTEQVSLHLTRVKLSTFFYTLSLLVLATLTNCHLKSFTIYLFISKTNEHSKVHYFLLTDLF